MKENDKCRVCFATDNLISVFVEQDEMVIAQMIMKIASVSISSHDELPQSICSSCLDRLKDCYSFKLDCERSDATLRSQIFQGKDAVPEHNGNQNNLENVQLESNKKVYSTVKKKRVKRKQNELSTEVQSDINIKVENEQDNLEIDGTKKVFVNTDIAIEKYNLPVSECLFVEPPFSEKSFNDDNVQGKSKIIKAQREQCFTCGRVMSSRFRLKMHLRTHTGEKPFTCLHCNKTFSLAQNLKVHQRVHTGEKPLRCPTCGKTFAQSAGLITHQRLHTGETPYRCTLCPASFRTPGHVQYHIRQHTGEKKFECETCHRAFITRSDLKQHVQTHTGDRPHVCCVCGLRLARASHLKRHMAIHDGPKPHACQVCPSTFLHKSDLTKHMKRHASSEPEKDAGKEKVVDEVKN